MGPLLSYAISSALMLLALYLTYKCLMAGDNQHRYNRAVLIGIYAVALLWPLMPQISLPATDPAAATDVTTVIDTLPIITDVPAPTSSPLWVKILLLTYLTGAGATLLLTLSFWWQLHRIVASGQKCSYKGYTLVITDRNVAPFSWLRYIIISRKDMEADISMILTHELSHLRHHHWADLLMAQAVIILQWFNPAAWLMRDELRIVHEYQADMSVLASGVNAREYQLMLIKKAVGKSFPALANSLNHSKHKKRITMMYKSKSGNARRMRSIALLPAALLAAAVVNIPAVASVIDNAQSCSLTSAESAGKVSDITEKKQTRTTTVTVSKNKEAEKVVVVNAGTIKKDTIKQAQKVTTVNVEDIDGEIMINGKKASKEELKNINPQSVENIAISKDGQMSITLKKDADTNNAPASKNIKKVVVVGASTMKKEDTGKTSERKVILDGSETELVIYANDKKITNEQLRKIKPEDIKSILVEKEKDVMRVTLKEGVEVPE